MKRKFLLPILSVCMVVALVSVGFAAWLITGNDTTDAQGSFVTYDVSNNYFTVTATTAAEADKTITFGKPVDTDAAEEGYQAPSTTYDWLSMEDVDEENLTVTFTITITPEVAFAAASDGTPARTVSTLLGTDKVQVKLTGPAAYDTAVSKGAVAYPTMKLNAETSTVSVDTGKTFESDGVVLTIPAEKFTESSDKATATATVTITYDWGTAFGGKNPYEHFNNTYATANTTVGSTTGKAAVTSLMGYVHALNSNSAYTLALAVVPAPTPAAQFDSFSIKEYIKYHG